MTNSVHGCFTHMKAHVLKYLRVQNLGQPEQANEAFSTSLFLCAHLPSGWLSWGSFCDEQHTAMRDASWLESGVTAYLQANPSTSPMSPGNQAILSTNLC